MKQSTDDAIDELLRALAHPFRRRLLRKLRRQQATSGRETVSLETISAALGVSEERAEIDLYHRHLPALAAVGLVEVPDQGQTDGGADEGVDDSQDIVPGPRFERGITILNAVTESSRRTR